MECKTFCQVLIGVGAILIPVILIFMYSAFRLSGEISRKEEEKELKKYLGEENKWKL